MSIKDLERRLGAVLQQAFDECGTASSAFKIIESFHGLLEREFLQVRLKSCIDCSQCYMEAVKWVVGWRALDECGTALSAFKIIESFHGLLEREFLQVRLETCIHCNQCYMGAVRWVGGWRAWTSAAQRSKSLSRSTDC